MVSKAKLRRRAKRAAIKKKYADLKNAKSSRIDKRVEEASKIKPIEDGEFLEDGELFKKMRMARVPYKNKNLDKKGA